LSAVDALHRERGIALARDHLAAQGFFNALLIGLSQFDFNRSRVLFETRTPLRAGDGASAAEAALH